VSDAAVTTEALRRDPRVRVFADPAAIARAAALEVIARAEAAVRERGRFTIALAGGSTPKALYALLASEERLPGDDRPLRARVPWDRTEVFFGDERHVGPADAQSNFRMADEALLSRVPLAPERIHRIRGEDPDAHAAARAYEEEMRRALGAGPAETPRLDLALLGLGADAHTASLFPGTWAVRERTALVAAPWVDKLSTYRITLTATAFNEARAVLFLVAGKDKAPALRSVLASEGDTDRHPARSIRPREGALAFWVDEAALG